MARLGDVGPNLGWPKKDRPDALVRVVYNDMIPVGSFWIFDEADLADYFPDGLPD